MKWGTAGFVGGILVGVVLAAIAFMGQQTKREELLRWQVERLMNQLGDNYDPTR